MDAHRFLDRLTSGQGCSPQDAEEFHQGIRWQTQLVTAQQVVMENGWRATARQVQDRLWDVYRQAASLEECLEVMASLSTIEGFQEEFETLWGTREDFIREVIGERQLELFA